MPSDSSLSGSRWVATAQSATTMSRPSAQSQGTSFWCFFEPRLEILWRSVTVYKATIQTSREKIHSRTTLRHGHCGRLKIVAEFAVAEHALLVRTARTIQGGLGPPSVQSPDQLGRRFSKKALIPSRLSLVSNKTA